MAVVRDFCWVGAETGLTEGGVGLGGWGGAVLTRCDRSRTDEVMGAREAVSSSLFGTELATEETESLRSVRRFVRVSTLSRRVARALMDEQRRGRITASPVEMSLESSWSEGRGTVFETPSLESVSLRKFLTYMRWGDGGTVEEGRDGPLEEGRLKAQRSSWTDIAAHEECGRRRSSLRVLVGAAHKERRLSWKCVPKAKWCCEM